MLVPQKCPQPGTDEGLGCGCKEVVIAGTNVDQGAFSCQLGEDMHRMKLMYYSNLFMCLKGSRH